MKTMTHNPDATQQTLDDVARQNPLTLVLREPVPVQVPDYGFDLAVYFFPDGYVGGYVKVLGKAVAGSWLTYEVKFRPDSDSQFTSIKAYDYQQALIWLTNRLEEVATV